MGFFDRNRRQLAKLGYEPDPRDRCHRHGDPWREQRCWEGRS